MGGLQYIQFNSDETVFVDPIICSRETKRKLQEGLLMLYTGMTRSAAGVLREHKANTENDPQRRQSLEKVVHLARELREALCQNDADSFGEILHQGWMMKKTLAAQISNNRIDEWSDRARCHGAIGGKILGAGGGGFLLLYAPPERHQGILAALPELS
jgi:D-glycero-alpha-D-manno-heptose-7-phosphate kinase